MKVGRNITSLRKKIAGGRRNSGRKERRYEWKKAKAQKANITLRVGEAVLSHMLKP